MTKRTLFFSNKYHLSTQNQQLLIYDKEANEKKTVPIEDIGYIVFEHPQITFTQSVIQLLAQNNTAVIFCDKNFMPASMLLHLETNQVQAEVFKNQINAGVALKKNLWQQTIQTKIRNQAALLKKLNKPFQDLIVLSGEVKSGDTTNTESIAARLYWPRLMGGSFRRARHGEPPNHLLNYGYTILRAAAARALSGSGLLPTLGIFHRNRYNAFALADDIMEPYRPFVDEMVVKIIDKYSALNELNKEIKKLLLGILTIDVVFGKVKRPMMVGLSQTTASMVKCFSGEKKKLEYPILQ